MSGHEEHDMLAAEYALGCLDPAETREAERRMTEDPSFAREVAAWQTRLAPLATHVPEMQPPSGLWHRIDVSTSAVVVPLRRLRIWQASTWGALALAASVAAFVLLRPVQPARFAVLAPDRKSTRLNSSH